MDPELITLIVIVVCISSFIVLDIWLAKKYGIQNTISDRMRTWTHSNWWGMWVLVVLCFGLGGLVGHFFLCPACSQVTPWMRLPLNPIPMEIQ